MLDWLQITRNQAEEKFRSLPEPTGKDENFRFTQIPLPNLGEAIESKAQDLGGEEKANLFLNQVQADKKGETVGIFSDLPRALTLNTDLVKQKWKQDAFANDKYSQLIFARWKNGTFYHVPSGMKDEPVRTHSFVSKGENYYRHLIVLEDGAEATWIQESSGTEDEAFLGEFVEIQLGKNAKLHWVQLQRLGGNTRSVLRQRVVAGEGSKLKMTPLFVGGSQGQLRLESQLMENAEVELFGAARGEGNQHFDFWVDVLHLGSRSKSQMNFHFVMGGGSKGIFNGLIHIPKNSLGCEASQKSKTLLMGAKSTVHAIPKLIIQTDQVKCSHGASVSTVNPEQLHYLRSRGISATEAEKMIVAGFTEPVLERFPLESLQGRAEAALGRKLDLYQ